MITHWDRAVLLHYYNAPPARPEALSLQVTQRILLGFRASADFRYKDPNITWALLYNISDQVSSDNKGALGI